MTKDEMRLAIAKAMGWSQHKFNPTFWTAPGGECTINHPMPNWPDDLNAMHEAEKQITDDEWPKYRGLLDHYAFFTASPEDARYYRPHCCTAEQRAMAWLRTKGLWK